ncbi:hypothetical protein SPHINGO391_440147 [Sphingomonas aurantiaca]|uniref:Uncharacterized protein n=1 Tax=Sphingomonas aurantiaca TaxID=185949 RepID=A0A5E7Z4W6_9SPHN|nr:hypothetical protein SPHINGO391_440147 [Sphingomonas aurantiaca]
MRNGMSVTPVIGASTTGLSIRTGPIWMGVKLRMNVPEKEASPYPTLRCAARLASAGMNR